MASNVHILSEQGKLQEKNYEQKKKKEISKKKKKQWARQGNDDK